MTKERKIKYTDKRVTVLRRDSIGRPTAILFKEKS